VVFNQKVELGFGKFNFIAQSELRKHKKKIAKINEQVDLHIPRNPHALALPPFSEKILRATWPFGNFSDDCTMFVFLVSATCTFNDISCLPHRRIREIKFVMNYSEVLGQPAVYDSGPEVEEEQN
jgi:hypothetical protein